MIVTALILLLVPALFFRSLRKIAYGLHVLSVTACAWGLSFFTPNISIFSTEALNTVLMLHLISINIVTLGLYIYNRAFYSPQYRPLISENTFHLFMLLGGTLGAMAGRNLFRGNMKRVSFHITFWLIFIVQVGALTLIGIWQYS